MRPFYLFRQPAAITIYVIGLAIAVFAPLDIMDRLPWMRVLSVPLSELFPPIYYYAKKSYFPQVTELYFTVMWLLSPPTLYWVWRWFPEVARISKEDLRSPIKFAFRYFFFLVVGVIIVIPALIIMTWFLNEGYEFIWMPVKSSRWALGIFGYFLAGVGGWWLFALELKLIQKIFRDIKQLVIEKGQIK